MTPILVNIAFLLLDLIGARVMWMTESYGLFGFFVFLAGFQLYGVIDSILFAINYKKAMKLIKSLEDTLNKKDKNHD
jgi:hypothetical protein